ncbi:MAG: hypothetical protein ACK5JR_11950 [Tropicimonas sp.]|uniref:hypothetical protein n=1 Tax=Tropicimonas sp. TaxID=2067044 RepID=UPI003A8C1E28
MQDFARRFHFGVQGITATEAETREVIGQMLGAGRAVRAFDTEMSLVPFVRGLLPEGFPVHVPIAYPMGNVPPALKAAEAGRALDLGVVDICISLDIRAALSGRWDDIAADVALVEEAWGAEFAGPGGYLAHIVPGQILDEASLLECCEAVRRGGGQVIKINPGAGLHVSPEQIAAIFERFGHDAFDVHPSGGIRDYDSAIAYLRMGCTTIHTRSALEIIAEYERRQREGIALV